MIHLLPREVWRGYNQIYYAQPGWGEQLNRYRISTIVVDKEHQAVLGPVLRQDRAWVLKYEDELTLIFERAPKSAAAPASETEPAPQARSLSWSATTDLVHHANRLSPAGTKHQRDLP